MLSRSPIKRHVGVKRSNKPIPKVNAKRKAKRKIGYRKMLASPEYKAARKEAMERAGGMCEAVEAGYGYGGAGWQTQRCSAIAGLHAHHLRYPKVRPLAASDLQILCTYHHEQAEALKMHKTRMY